MVDCGYVVGRIWIDLFKVEPFEIMQLKEGGEQHEQI